MHASVFTNPEKLIETKAVEFIGIKAIDSNGNIREVSNVLEKAFGSSPEMSGS